MRRSSQQKTKRNRDADNDGEMGEESQKPRMPHRPKAPSKQEKKAALAIGDRPKKIKPNSPDAPLQLPDRSRQAKRKPDQPKDAPDENVKKLSKTLSASNTQQEQA